MKRLFFSLLFLVASVASAASPPRPVGNTGSGFYVSGDKLVDPAGNVIILRGSNDVHWDHSAAVTSIPLSGANAVRQVVDFNQPLANNLARNTAFNNQGLVTIPGNWGGTCKSDPASLSAVVDTWVNQASGWTTTSHTTLINIANEWGPPNSVVWRDNYITAIKRMRAAGYLNTLVIDSGGCGQDTKDLVAYGADLLAADPQHNLLFDLHIYGGLNLTPTVAWQVDYTKALAALKAVNLPIIVGEFGPGRGIGPSPTQTTPERIIADAETYGWSWLAWGWNDNNLGGCLSDDNWFSMTIKCAFWDGKTQSQLTKFGQTVVPLYAQYKTVKAVFVSPVVVAAPPASAPASSPTVIPKMQLMAAPATLWCTANYSCSMGIGANASTKIASYALEGNDPRITLSKDGVFGWYSSPVIGTYSMMLVLTDIHGQVVKTPLTLVVSWCPGKVC